MARSSGDFDAVGIAEDHGIVCVAVMFFRGGRSLGTRNFFPKLVKGADDDEIIRAFLLQYYGGREAPKEILVSRAVPEAAALAELLSAQSDHKVAIKSRVRGDRARFVEMAVTNARHGAELRYQASASYERPARGARRSARARRAADAARVLRRQPHGAARRRSRRASCSAPEGPLKSDYRRFNIDGIAPGDDYGAMAQVLTRRYARVKQGEVPMPDVLFIDGGPGQLAQRYRRAAGARRSRARALVGVAKGQDRKPGRESLYLPERDGPAAFAAELAGITLDPAAARRGASVRDHRPSRAAAEGAHALAARGHSGARSEESAASLLRAVRRVAGADARGHRRLCSE